MKGFVFLILGVALYLAAIISIVGIMELAKDSGSHYVPKDYTFIGNGRDGGALGLGIVAASLIVCGSFFLYKAFSDTKK